MRISLWGKRLGMYVQQQIGMLVLVTGCMAVIGFATPAAAFTAPGDPTSYVNDFANVLSASDTHALDGQLRSLEQATSEEIAVVTVPTTGDDTIESYTNQLFHSWGIGQKGKNNGVMLLLAINDRHVRIEVGYGLEPVLTDARSAEIIRDATPLLKAKAYTGAVQLMVGEIQDTLTGDTNNASTTDAYAQIIEQAATQGQDGFWMTIGAWACLVFAMALFFILIAYALWKASQKKGSGGFDSGSWSSSSRDSWSSDSSSSSSSSDSDSDSFGGGDSGGGGASGSW